MPEQLLEPCFHLVSSSYNTSMPLTNEPTRSCLLVWCSLKNNIILGDKPEAYVEPSSLHAGFCSSFHRNYNLTFTLQNHSQHAFCKKQEQPACSRCSKSNTQTVNYNWLLNETHPSESSIIIPKDTDLVCTAQCALHEAILVSNMCKKQNKKIK